LADRFGDKQFMMKNTHSDTNSHLILLAADTSCSAGAVGLIRGEQTLEEIHLPPEKAFSETLLPAIDRLLNGAGVRLMEIDCIGVTQGPGSFTGLRIGLATMKTLAYTLNKPMVGMVSLEVLAWARPPGTGRIIPVLSARPGWVYSGVYQKTEEGLICLQSPSLISLEDCLGVLQPGDFPVGEGALKIAETLRRVFPETPFDDDPRIHFPRGAAAAQLARQQILKGGLQSAHQIAALYLQASVAEVRWEEKQKEKSGKEPSHVAGSKKEDR